MSAIGWGKIGGKAQHKTGLVQLSAEEEELVARCSEEFANRAKTQQIQSEQDALDASYAIVDDVCAGEGIDLDSDQRDYISRYVMLNSWGFAFLQPLLQDDRIEEIAVLGLGKPAYAYLRGEGWKQTDFGFTSEGAYIDAINKMSRSLGRRITYQNPRLNAVLPDGTRLHASIPPVSKFEITLRRFNPKPITAPQLASLKTASAEAMAFLWLAMQSDANILIAGNTASGKTTTLNALFNFVPISERVVILEETPEINIPHPHSTRMIAVPELEIGMQDLVADSLRMRPDRVIVGEVRTRQETEGFVESILSGQARGTYATYHAKSAREAVLRMKSCGVLEIDIPAIDLIVVQRRIGRYEKGRGIVESRRIVQISQPGPESPENVDDLFSYDHARDELSMNPDKKKLAQSRIWQKLKNTFGMDDARLFAEISRRAKKVAEMGRKNLPMEKVVEEAQNA
ncbi:MAG: ATPase, T2SS/T4P/T4SS family [Candidatus Micrarchaeia archaeon]